MSLIMHSPFNQGILQGEHELEAKHRIERNLQSLGLLVLYGPLL